MVDLEAQARQILEGRRLKWRETAAELDVSYSWISKFVRGKFGSSRYDTLKKIVEFYGPKKRAKRRRAAQKKAS